MHCPQHVVAMRQCVPKVLTMTGLVVMYAEAGCTSNSLPRRTSKKQVEVEGAPAAA